MEESGGKRGSGSHAERPTGRSTARKEGSLKRKYWKVVEDGAVVKRTRSGGKGRKEVLAHGYNSEVKRWRRRLNFSVLEPNAAGSESEFTESRSGRAGSGNSDSLSGIARNEGGTRNPDVVNNVEGVDASSKNEEVSGLCSCLEGGVIVPKRPRGASRRKKSERSLTPRRAAAGLSDFLSSIETDAHSEKVVGDGISPNFASGSKKEKVVGGDGKEPSSRSRKRVSAMVALPAKDEEKPRGKITEEKLQRNRRTVASDAEKESQMENGMHLADARDNLDQHVDEEENLEHNAARMLSSRFDPRCTDTSNAGSHSERHASEPRSSRRRNSMTLSSAADATGRLLRPRKRDSANLVRKRRHFYEVHATDMDSYWVVKKKIKVFCPLDHAWCFGVVKDYNPDTKMHLIKYDGRDEEWADLQKERIKLLLFPSEICGNSDSQRVDLEVEGSVSEQLQQVASDNSPSSLMDSEPIISYYARLTQRVKKSSVKIPKKKSRSKSNKSSLPAGGNLSRLKSKALPTGCMVSEGLDMEISKLPTLVSRNIPFDRRFSFMYSRKRSCKVKRESENIIKESGGSTTFLVPQRGFQLNIASKLMKLEQGRLKLRIYPICLQFLSEEHPFFRELLFHWEYAVTLLWPVVYMEIVFVDKAVGWRFISFEGCLNHLVVILSLIMRLLPWSTDCTDCLKMQMPCALVSCKLSGLQGISRAIFMSFNLDRECLKWALLECRLNNFHALMMRQVSFSDHNTENVRRCLGGAVLMPYIFQMVPLEDPWDKFLMDESIPEKPLLASYAQSAATESPLCTQHPKLPLENKISYGNLQNCNTASPHVSHGNNGKVTDGSSSVADDSSDQVSEITLENAGSSQSQTADLPSFSLTKVEADALSLSSDDGWKRTSSDLVKSGPDTAENSVRNSVRNVNSKKFLRSQRQPRRSGLWRAAWNSYSQFLDDISSPDKSDDGTHNYSEMIHARRKRCNEEQDADLSKSELSWKIAQDNVLPSPENKGFCIMQHPVSPDFACFSENYSADFPHDGYINRYRKPRTQVQYSLPHLGYDFCSRPKSKKRKRHPSKKVKSDITKYKRAGSKSSCSYPKSFTCEANVLVTDGDRGWRECAAQVVLDCEDQCWKLLVKLSGNTKYSYKADQFIQPGTTNRYTHAMMWKGGNNWALEFTDRNQWASFKEMHEECYNRNIRAASVKNIPIPGVRLIEDNNYIVSTTYSRSLHYIRQVGNEVDSAMVPSRIVYDMDSDDEEFIERLRNLADGFERKPSEMSDELFEKAMGILEKFSYSQKCDEFSETEIERLLAEIGTSSLIWSIYEHWRAKRQKKGVPLVRQFQPALWEQYQKKLKEWEVAASQTTACSNGQQEKHIIEKPPMFAFCLKPRRLKVLNKNSNQRPHKKFSHQTPHQKEQDRTRLFGRKLNKLSGGNDGTLVSILDHRSHRNSVLPWNGHLPPCAPNTTAEAKRSGKSKRIQHLTLHGSNPKKMGIFQSHRDPGMMEMVYDLRTNNGGQCTWNTGLPECSSTRQIHSDKIHASPAELEEFRLRDASNAAQHALTMAKLKREKAEWLLRKADLAIHKATVTLIMAEAIKASEEDLIGDG